MKAKPLFLLFLCLITIPAVFSQVENDGPTWTNPVSDSIYMGDPFILQHKGMYYLYGTTSSGTGFKCWSSNDLTTWKYEGFAYKETDKTWGEGNYWAPEVYFHNGLFYLAYSCNGKDTTNKRMLLCLAKSNSPTGPFTDLHAPWFDPGYSCIDAHIFFDDDGRIYLYYDKVGYEGQWPDGHLFGYIFCRELGAGMMPVSDPVFCSKAEQDWEHPESKRSRCNEGCAVIKHNGVYYMTYSANHYQDPYYGIGYSTAGSPFGPWEKYSGNPLIGMDEKAGIFGPGHNNFFTSPDSSQLYIVYHTHVSKSDTRRQVNIDRIRFDQKGRMLVLKQNRTKP